MNQVITGITSTTTVCCREFGSNGAVVKYANQNSTMVTPEMSAQDRKWWTDERYAIYELNVNSAVAYPQHEEVLDLATAGPSYTVKGYAYAGGGRRITKVEISLDRGKCKE